MTGPDPLELARLLRQRSEMGQPPIVLAGGSREALLEAARRTMEGEATRADEPEAGESETAPAAAPGSPAGSDDRAAESAGAMSLDAPGTPVGGRPLAATPGPPAVSTPEAPDEPEVQGGANLEELDYPGLREVALGCTRCGLAETRTQVVFSDGNPQARLVVVGEAPGANEDRTGLPFVGQAGKLLDLMLASIDLSRETSVYICNVLKCRPPGNRNPQAHEIRACSPFLRRQLAMVRPEALLAVGTFAAQLLTSVDAPLGKLRGTVHSYQGIPLVATYHPAALLRNSGWVRAAWDDLQLLSQVMD